MPWNPRGATPMTLRSRPLTRNDSPAAPGRPPSLFCQYLVRDDHDWRPPGVQRLLGREEPAERWTQSKGAEIVARDEQPVCTLDPPGRADVCRRHARGNELAKRREPFAHVLVLRPRRARVGSCVGSRLDQVVARRVRHTWQRLEDDRLDPREDHRVDADPDRERQHDDGGDNWHPRYRAQRMAKVPEHGRSSVAVNRDAEPVQHASAFPPRAEGDGSDEDNGQQDDDECAVAHGATVSKRR